jgi:hypothetical protein
MFKRVSSVRGGCVWQASRKGQDGFQEFDCGCRHIEFHERTCRFLFAAFATFRSKANDLFAMESILSIREFVFATIPRPNFDEFNVSMCPKV